MKISRIVKRLGTAISVAAMAASCGAQMLHGGDAALTYQWVHSNAQPGDCGCFDLNGGGISASVALPFHLAAVAEVSAGYEGHSSSTGNTLTLVSYMGGPRYYVPWNAVTHHHLQPFGQLLLGAAHAGGGIAGQGDGRQAFAMRAGGGLDLTLSHVISVRLLQADYYLTDFVNTTNNHQNNVLLGAGVVLHWSR